MILKSDMNLDNPIRLARELKGAPLSILFVLSMVKTRVSQAWLERATGYTDKPVSRALAYMEEISLVDWTSAGWQLTGEARQLPLPLQLEENVAEEEEVAEENSDDSCQGRKVSDSVIIIINDSEDEEDLSNNNNNKAPTSRKNSDSNDKKKVAVDKTVDNFGENAPAERGDVPGTLAKVRIVGKKRLSLAKLPWMTDQYIERWEAHLKLEKGMDYKPGLLITYLESGAEAPEPVELDEFRQPKKDYRTGLIKAGLICEFCQMPIQDCDCEAGV